MNELRNIINKQQNGYFSVKRLYKYMFTKLTSSESTLPTPDDAIALHYKI